MTNPVIRLDRSKPFSECRGERQPDDPCYRVANWQGQMVGKDMILLPYDSQDLLVPDDGRTDPWQGKDAEAKPVTHYPLYTQPMRDLLARKVKRLTAPAQAAAEEVAAGVLDDDVQAEERDTAADVNFVSWLRGEARYEWPMLQKAAKDRFSRVFTKKGQMVVDLVLDEKLVPEDQVCEELATFLKSMKAA